MAKRGEGEPFVSEVLLYKVSGGSCGVSMEEAIRVMGKDLQDMVNSYDARDISILAAVMQMTADSLLAMSGGRGRELCELIKGAMVTVAVPVKADDLEDHRGG